MRLWVGRRCAVCGVCGRAVRTREKEEGGDDPREHDVRRHLRRGLRAVIARVALRTLLPLARRAVCIVRLLRQRVSGAERGVLAPELELVLARRLQQVLVPGCHRNRLRSWLLLLLQIQVDVEVVLSGARRARLALAEVACAVIGAGGEG